MLVLKRRQGQEIVIDGQIRIVVVQTGDGSCSLAFEAPRDCRIRRAELPVFEEECQRISATQAKVPVAAARLERPVLERPVLKRPSVGQSGASSPELSDSAGQIQRVSGRLAPRQLSREVPMRPRPSLQVQS
ncbi:MAG: carbon storage regulator [Planctomycetaceae bacterium]|jgi:carbon storage regulator CsrA